MATATATRIKPLVRLKTSILKWIIEARLKAPTFPLTDRLIGQPEVHMVPTRHGQVRCYVYRAHPDAPMAQSRSVPPVHVNIHGGGFILAKPRQDDHVVNYLAAEVGVTVVNLDYSTAPRVQFPVAEEQCSDVLTWVAKSGAEMGWDATRISVGGGSAGAKLVLSVLHLAHQAHGPKVRAAITVVPFTDATLPAESYRSTKAKPDISPNIVRIIRDTYFLDEARRSEPLASPAHDPDLADAVPPLLVLIAGQDTLAPQGRALVEQLTAAGAPVTCHEFAEQDHTWLALQSTPLPVMKKSVELMGAHLIEHLSPADQGSQ